MTSWLICLDEIHLLPFLMRKDILLLENIFTNGSELHSFLGILTSTSEGTDISSFIHSHLTNSDMIENRLSRVKSYRDRVSLIYLYCLVNDTLSDLTLVYFESPVSCWSLNTLEMNLSIVRILRNELDIVLRCCVKSEGARKTWELAWQLSSLMSLIRTSTLRGMLTCTDK